MKLIDRNGRLFGKVSVIDVIVVLVVLVLAAAVFTKSRMPQTSDSVTMTPVEFQFQLTNQPEYMLDAIREGDELYDQTRSSGGAMGRVTGIEVTDGTNRGTLADGTTAMLPAEGYYDILLTVEGSALVEADGTVLLNKVYVLATNAARNLYTTYASFSGRIMDVTILDAAAAE